MSIYIEKCFTLPEADKMLAAGILENYWRKYEAAYNDADHLRANNLSWCKF
jgi:hypothetical protein